MSRFLSKVPRYHEFHWSWPCVSFLSPRVLPPWQPSWVGSEPVAILSASVAFMTSYSNWNGPFSIRRRCLHGRHVHSYVFDMAKDFWEEYDHPLSAKAESRMWVSSQDSLLWLTNTIWFPWAKSAMTTAIGWGCVSHMLTMLIISSTHRTPSEGAEVQLAWLHRRPRGHRRGHKAGWPIPSWLAQVGGKVFVSLYFRCNILDGCKIADH